MFGGQAHGQQRTIGGEAIVHCRWIGIFGGEAILHRIDGNAHAFSQTPGKRTMVGGHTGDEAAAMDIEQRARFIRAGGIMRSAGMPPRSTTCVLKRLGTGRMGISSMMARNSITEGLRRKRRFIIRRTTLSATKSCMDMKRPSPLGALV